MPSPKPSSQRVRGRLREKSMSFHGRGSPVAGPTMGQLRRPKTVPDLPSAARIGGGAGGVSLQATSPSAAAEGRPKLTRLLLNVTIQGSLGPVQVLMSPESTVGDLIAAAVWLYVKEGRRPVLPTSDPAGYDLHYSQFSLESLNKEEKLGELGSRNFFLCKRKSEATAGAATSSSSSCAEQAEKARKNTFGLPWLKLMGFLQ